MGNSAMDIAVETSYIADETYLAARRGAHIIPKYIFGKPLDQVLGTDPRMPLKIRQAMIRRHPAQPDRQGRALRPTQARPQARRGSPDDLRTRSSTGSRMARSRQAEHRQLEGERVRFVDGSEVEADIVVYCTGYKVTFPFFDEDFVSAPDNDLPLFRRVFKPGIDNVFFVGLLQPLGAVMPLAEAQGRWVADYLRGEYALPPSRQMRADIAAEHEAMFKRYVATKRHTIQVDFEDYLRDLAAERRAGGARARANGYIPPASCRPSAVTTAS